MCVISGKVDYIVQAMDDEIKKIVCMITELDDLAYATQTLSEPRRMRYISQAAAVSPTTGH